MLRWLAAGIGSGGGARITAAASKEGCHKAGSRAAVTSGLQGKAQAPFSSHILLFFLGKIAAVPHRQFAIVMDVVGIAAQKFLRETRQIQINPTRAPFWAISHRLLSSARKISTMASGQPTRNSYMREQASLQSGRREASDPGRRHVQINLMRLAKPWNPGKSRKSGHRPLQGSHRSKGSYSRITMAGSPSNSLAGRA